MQLLVFPGLLPRPEAAVPCFLGNDIVSSILIAAQVPLVLTRTN